MAEELRGVMHGVMHGVLRGNTRGNRSEFASITANWLSLGNCKIDKDGFR